MEEQELEMHKETVEISGDRNLYNYTFSLDGKKIEVEPPKPRTLETNE